MARVKGRGHEALQKEPVANRLSEEPRQETEAGGMLL